MTITCNPKYKRKLPLMTFFNWFYIIEARHLYVVLCFMRPLNTWHLHTFYAAGVLNGICVKNSNILITNYSEIYLESIEYRVPLTIMLKNFLYEFTKFKYKYYLCNRLQSIDILMQVSKKMISLETPSTNK